MTTGGNGEKLQADDPFVSKAEECFTFTDVDAETFYSFFAQLHATKKHFNVHIICQGNYFKAHQLVLMAQSQYFRRLLSSNEANGGMPEMHKLDCDPTIFQHVLEYMYTGKIRVDTKHLKTLSEMASFLGIRKLITECHRARIADLVATLDNCLEIWSVGEEARDRDMIEKSIDIVLENFSILQYWPQFMELPLICITKCLSHKKLNVESVEERLTCGLMWLRHDGLRPQHIVTILQALPLHDMKGWFLKHNLHDPLIHGNSQAKGLVNDVIIAQKKDNQVNKSGASQCQKSTYIIGLGTMSWDGKRFQPAGQEVYAISSSLPGTAKSLPIIPSDMPKHAGIACCSNVTMMFVSGVGRNRNEVWGLDLEKMKWLPMGHLRDARMWHCMAVVAGNVYVFGGRNTSSVGLQKYVEVCDTKNGTCIWRKDGEIKGSICYNTICQSTQAADILLAGARDDCNSQVLQIYSTDTHSVKHLLEWRAPYCWLFGLAVTDQLVIICSGDGLYTCPLKAVYSNDRSRVIALAPRCLPPNFWCGMTLAEDSKTLILIGGFSRSRDKIGSKVFRASVDELQQNIGCWKESGKSGLGQCLVMPSSYCSAELPSPQ